ncbi:MAG: Uma2 family endonuclease [Planctomycetes bacterium]|nr:Uma2 family endonuclease [Planctomycetota bacterium]
MATKSAAKEERQADRPPVLPPLENGDRLSRAEFERRYEAMPNLKKAELIEGVVHVGSPVKHEGHSREHSQVVTWLGVYVAYTPGVDGGAESSLRMDLDSEPQPDALLRIGRTAGGQSGIDPEGYIEGAPELIAEVAATSASYDLGTKLRVYRRHGVREYIVWRVLDGEIDWFVLRDGEYRPFPPDAQGIRKSETFPGLWLDAGALLAGDMATVLAVLRQGLDSPEHAAFVARLIPVPGA